jgi:hypothetical protein
MPNSFEIIVDSKAVAERCFVLFIVEALGALGNCGSVDPGLLRGCLSLSNAVLGRWSLKRGDRVSAREHNGEAPFLALASDAQG